MGRVYGSINLQVARCRRRLLCRGFLTWKRLPGLLIDIASDLSFIFAVGPRAEFTNRRVKDSREMVVDYVLAASPPCTQ